jgi:hypothetical protein
MKLHASLLGLRQELFELVNDEYGFRRSHRQIALQCVNPFVPRDQLNAATQRGASAVRTETFRGLGDTDPQILDRVRARLQSVLESGRCDRVHGQSTGRPRVDVRQRTVC